MLQNPISLPENILYPRDTGKTYDEFRDEALRVLQLMPAWEPAVNRIHGPASIDTGLFFYFNEEGKAGLNRRPVLPKKYWSYFLGSTSGYFHESTPVLLPEVSQYSQRSKPMLT